jgi:hypothetical protein
MIVFFIITLIFENKDVNFILTLTFVYPFVEHGWPREGDMVWIVSTFGILNDIID